MSRSACVSDTQERPLAWIQQEQPKKRGIPLHPNEKRHKEVINPLTPVFARNHATRTGYPYPSDVQNNPWIDARKHTGKHKEFRG